MKFFRPPCRVRPALSVALAALALATGTPGLAQQRAEAVQLAQAAPASTSSKQKAAAKPAPSNTTQASKPAQTTNTRRESGIPGHYEQRDDVKQFIAGMVERHRFDEQALEKTLAAVRKQPDALRLIAPAPVPTKRSWTNYRARFLDQTRIRGGLDFIEQHRSTLERAAGIYGVPVEVIAAIIGVETIYGRVTGSFRVIDVLTTLAFDYPRRADFFRGELENFLLLTRDASLDPFEPRGSFAGAIGIPQFMPGSIRRYAVDFDKDGRIDLQASPADAIGSVARFLAEHGWVPGGPVYFPSRINADAKLEPLIEAGIEPRYTSAELSGFGVRAVGEVPEGTRMALIDLPDGDNAPVYLLGARNFYVVTRYNRSSFYATAVLELADALKKGS